MKELFPGVYSANGRLYTLNLVPGERVYNEHLMQHEGREYRSWNPYKSKMAAAVLKGLKEMPVGRESNVLYLGAANGTTVSHISDIAVDGTIYAVEISIRAMSDLVKVCNVRPNIVPILADANKPEKYRTMVGVVDIIYQDISQRDQTGIFLKNMERFGADRGMLMVKARSIDVSMPPRKVFEKVKKDIGKAFHIKEAVNLSPYSRDHMAISVVKK
ncbi:MAG: fibrillarin-like rRNA/tRNA 2'-O-methyltransferase [Nitrospiraceae bacterium]|nr:fibrillarin-like rRNA/tRNA 2'-O-methyltransferase [Nitrospiraceae bacterium]